MYAQSYSPLCITDSVYLVNMLTNDKRRHKHLHVTPRRKNKLPSLQMIPATYQEGDVDEKELSDSDIIRKLKAKHTSADIEDDRTGTSDYYNDSDCVPREISVILSPTSSYPPSHQKQHQYQATEPCDDVSCFAASDVPHLVGVSFDSDYDLDCVPREISVILSPSSSYPAPHQKQHQDQTPEPCDDDSWFAASDVPHLIGVSFDPDDDDEDNEKDYKDMH